LNNDEINVAVITGKNTIHDFELHLSQRSSHATRKTTINNKNIIAKKIIEIKLVTF